MTNAKIKAKELVFKYNDLVNVWDYHYDEPTDLKQRLPKMKECALIAVYEILKVAFYADDKIYNYYLEVKQEIEKL
jgi:hypothetical protein